MSVTIDEAVGSPDTGYFVLTPDRPLRKWPKWSLRPQLPPMIARRWDVGGEITDELADEFSAWVLRSHRQVGLGLFALTEVVDGTLFVLSVFTLPPFRGQGHCSRWLDKLVSGPTPIAFPEVADLKLAQMLHRRGFELIAMADDDADPDDWLPVHYKEPAR